MKKLSLKTAIVAIVSFSFALTSCNTTLEVVKRKHRKGYHVSISNNKNQNHQIFEDTSKDTDSVSSIHLAIADSLVSLSLKNDLSLSINDSVNIDRASQSNLPTSKSKFTIAQKIKTVKRIKKKVSKIKQQYSVKSTSDDDIDSDIMFIILLGLSIILPPACVYLIKGKDSFSFKLNLVLWLIGFVGFGLAAATSLNLVWLAYLSAIIHALLVLLGYLE